MGHGRAATPRGSSAVERRLRAGPGCGATSRGHVIADTSRFAAGAALAARRQNPDLYLAFHDALMRATGRLTEEAVIDIAREAGVDVARMRADMADPGIEGSIKRNVELAKAIGINGTPSLVVGNAMLRGFKTRAQLEGALAEARPVAHGAAVLAAPQSLGRD